MTPLATLLTRRADRHGDRAYLAEADGPQVLRYADLPGIAERWTAALDAAGVPPGGRVALRADRPLTFAAAYLGVIAAGRCVVPVDPDAPAGTTAALLERTRPWLLVDDLGDPPPGGPPVLAPSDGGWAPGTPPAARSGATGPSGVLLGSSGTTGRPKLIELDQPRLLATAHAIVRHHGLTAADRGFSPLPLFHINAEVVGLLAVVTSGGELVLARRFHRSTFWDVVRSREVTWANLVPAIIAILARDTAPPPTRLRFVRSASAPLPVPVQERFEERCGVPVLQSYGMTEAASQITANGTGGTRKRGCVGRPVDVALRVLGHDGRPVVGTVGRVQIRGPRVIDRYAGGVGDDRFTPDGWLDTGDLGRLDADGDLFLAGRVDDVINRGGEKVYPAAVEDVLLGDPDVTEAVVVAQPDDVYGQVPVAAVVTGATGRPGDGRADGGEGADGGAALRARLAERCERMLPRPHRPVAVTVLHRLPTGPTGKVRRSLVAELLDASRVGAGSESAPR